MGKFNLNGLLNDKYFWLGLAVLILFIYLSNKYNWFTSTRERGEIVEVPPLQVGEPSISAATAANIAKQTRSAFIDNSVSYTVPRQAMQTLLSLGPRGLALVNNAYVTIYRGEDYPSLYELVNQEYFANPTNRDLRDQILIKLQTPTY